MAEELEQLLESLKDPESVLVNMMRGTIARPSVRAFSKLFGDVINGEDAQLLEIARLREELAQLPSRGGEAVAWLWYEQANEFNGYEGKRRISFTKPKGRCQPLYTHPADQVAEGVVVSRELLERLTARATVFDDGGDGADAESARSVASELRQLLAKSEGGKK